MPTPHPHLPAARTRVTQIVREQLPEHAPIDSVDRPLDLTSIPNATLLRLCRGLVQSRRVVLHGSNTRDAVPSLEPRQASDAAKQSGNRRAVYATVEVDAALANAVFDRSYAIAELDSFVFGHDFSSGRRQFRATDNLYRRFLARDPALSSDGFIYVLERARFVHSPDSVSEYMSPNAQEPLLTLKVSGRLADYLFVVGDSDAEDTVVPYHSDDSARIARYRLSMEAPPAATPPSSSYDIP